MPIEKLRDVGKYGILSDPDPYDLPLQGFSSGVNIRFRNNKITSGPVFRDALTLGTTNPRFLFGAAPTQSSTELFIGYKNGTITQYANGVETARTLPGYTTSSVEATWSGTTLDGLVYINRSDRAPWYILPTGTAFQSLAPIAPYQQAATTSTSGGTLGVATYYYKITALTASGETLPSNEQFVTTTGTTSSNTLSWSPVAAATGYRVYRGTATGAENVYYAPGNVTTFVDTGAASTGGSPPGTSTAVGANWDPTWSAMMLRQCSNALVALNVTKGITNYPNLVKTSQPVTTGAIPASWDQTVASTLATENTISMDGPITDACPLGQDLIIYGRREAWRMHADNSILVYSYSKLPFKKGSLNANCALELDGKNYVFGMDDIWVHDGVSEQSLCDGKTRDYIFSSLNLSKRAQYYIQFNPRLNEIYFAYVSGDALVNFVNGVDGCNRQAVYNITTGSWTFDDLPSTWSAEYAPLPNFLTYTSVTTTYTTQGGSYQDQEDGDKRVIAMVGSLNASYGLTTQLYAFDIYGTGSVAAFSVDAAATAPRYLERIGIDLDELNAELRGYKTISTIYPQARVNTSGGNYLQISVGASDYIGELVTTNWSAYFIYDGDTNYKIDPNIAGRWLGVRIKWNDYRDMTITGFDLDINITGNI
jgi:hypothetical protein